MSKFVETGRTKKIDFEWKKVYIILRINNKYKY